MDSLSALLALAAIAGAVHVLAPDHWFPASTLAWRRGWRAGTTVAFLAAVYAIHLGTGYALYAACLALGEPVVSVIQSHLMLFTIGLITVAAVIRSYRFSHIEGVMRSSSLSRWRLWTVLSLLGPCESLVPILLKAHQTGVEPSSVSLWFLGGTLAAGIALVLGSQRIWDQPELLARWVTVMRGRVAPIPVAGVVAGGLVYFLRLG